MFILEDGASTMPMKICQCYRTRVQKLLRWALRVPSVDQHLTTLIGLSNETGDGFEGFYILHGVEIGTRYNITGERDPLLQRGQRLNSPADLCTVRRSLVQAAEQSVENVPPSG